MAELNIVILLSVSIHPVSGRAKMARGDARGAEMALGLSANCLAIHAGDISNPALRDYLGLGIGKIEVLGPFHEGDDIVPSLVLRLSELKPDIILTGLRSEEGEASGMVPYLVARTLGLKHVASVTAVEAVHGAEAIIVQGHKGSPRRKLAVDLPALFSVSELAPQTRMCAFAKARRGKLEAIDVETTRDEEAARWARSPARRRPKKIAAGQFSRSGQALVDLTPDQAARRIAEFLEEIGILERKKRCP